VLFVVQFIKRYTQFILLGSLLLVAGCTMLTGSQGSLAVRVSAEERKARQLFEQGDYKQSALLYQRLASTPSARQDVLRLQTAQALLKNAQDDQAKDYLDLIAPGALTAEQRNQLYLMHAQLDLNSGNFELALKHLGLVRASSLSRPQKIEYYEMKSFSYALTGQLIKSVHEKITLDSYLQTEQRKANNIAILELLSLVPEQNLLEQQKLRNSFVYSGWLALELARRAYPGGVGREQALNDWADKYTGHPAQLLITEEYFLVSGFKLADLKDIAVFLPESGPYSLHAKALKAGFVAAYNQLQQGSRRPDVRFYDTGQISISSLYRQAIADGAQLVIGPLNKKYIKELAANNDLVVPVMALNYVEGLAKTNLYQFALSPIDEVQQAVRQARLSAYENAIILAPETGEGERISHYFQNAWEVLNGNVLQVQTFEPGARDFSLPVRQLLNINESQYRFQRLKKAVGAIEYKPRRRQDVDVIFLVASEQEARLINPQFYHNRAGSVAVYGLSRIYSGRPDKNKDIDLEGINFCTIPWLIDGAYPGDLSMSALQDLRTEFPDRYLSLIAFGIDAYAVVAHLNDLATIPYNGATGDLVLNEYNRIERHLVCARFKGGDAQLVEMDEGSYENHLNELVPGINPL